MKILGNHDRCRLGRCEGTFTKPLAESRKLAKQMYGFCPDIVDQGAGDVSRLALELKKTQRFFIWWD